MTADQPATDATSDPDASDPATPDQATSDLATETAADRRQVTLTRVRTGVYEARNAKGATLRFGSKDEEGFSPVELLLVALAGCSAVDIDVVTGRRTEPTRFDITSSAEVVHEGGNLLQDIAVHFDLGFMAGAAGDQARKVAPAAARASHDKTCTVSRTIERGVPVAMTLDLHTAEEPPAT